MKEISCKFVLKYRAMEKMESWRGAKKEWENQLYTHSTWWHWPLKNMDFVNVYLFTINVWIYLTIEMFTQYEKCQKSEETHVEWNGNKVKQADGKS